MGNKKSAKELDVLLHAGGVDEDPFYEVDSLREVAEELGVSEHRVRKWKRLGCPDLASSPYDVSKLLLWLPHEERAFISSETVQELHSYAFFEVTCSLVLDAFDLGDELLAERKSATSPTKNERAVVALTQPKTAALFFDRLWTPDVDVPESIRFCGHTQGEAPSIGVLNVFAEMADRLSEGYSKCDMPAAAEKALDFKKRFSIDIASPTGWQTLRDLIGARDNMSPILGKIVGSMEEHICSAYMEELGTHVLPMFPSLDARDRAYAVGDHEVISAVIDRLDLVDESKLEWNQVLELRQDKHARIKLRRLLNWLDHSMAGKPLTFVENEVAVRLDEYRSALQKHGVETVTGAISAFLDPKTLACAATVAGGLSFTSVQSAAVSIGLGTLAARALIEVVKVAGKRCETSEQSEIAYVHEIKKLGR